MKTKPVSIIASLLTLMGGLCAQTIHEAIRAGDLHKVKSLINENKSLLNTRYQIEKPVPIIRMTETVTPLFDAVLFGRYGIINYLIEKGVDLKKNNDALFMAPLQKWINEFRQVFL